MAGCVSCAGPGRKNKNSALSRAQGGFRIRFPVCGFKVEGLKSFWDRTSVGGFRALGLLWLREPRV